MPHGNSPIRTYVANNACEQQGNEARRCPFNLQRSPVVIPGVRNRRPGGA
jgi:hypothetical protein